MLQAYLDDSREAGELLVLGGYVATAQSWAAFSDEWAEFLQLVRPSDEFKMSEIASRWGQNDERIKWFYRIIERHIICEISVGIQLDVFSKVVNDFAWKFRGVTPYTIAIGCLFETLAFHRDELGLDGPIEFICDEQMDEKMHIYTAFEEAKNGVRMASSYKNMFSGSPRFADSKRFLPLQAADFFVWWMRKTWLKSPAAGVMWPYPWAMKRETRLAQIYIDEMQLKNRLWHASFLMTVPRCTQQPKIDYGPWFWPNPTCREI